MHNLSIRNRLQDTGNYSMKKPTKASYLMILYGTLSSPKVFGIVRFGLQQKIVNTIFAEKSHSEIGC